MRSSTHDLLYKACILQTDKYLKHNFYLEGKEKEFMDLYNKYIYYARGRTTVFINIFKTIDSNFPYKRNTQKLETFTCLLDNKDKMYIVSGKYNGDYEAVGSKLETIRFRVNELWTYSFPDADVIYKKLNEFSNYELNKKLGGYIQALRLGGRLK